MGTIRERKTSTGKVVFDAAVRRRGGRFTYRTFSRGTDARFWLQEAELALRNGRFLNQVEAQKHTLAEAIERYIEDEPPKKPKSYADQKRQLVWFKNELGFKVLAEVTSAALSDAKRKFLHGETLRHTQRRPQTWNRYHSALNRVFQMCCSEWQWLERNPLQFVRREKEPPGRVRFLHDDERQRLLEACKASRSPNLYPLVVSTLSTGMRRGEVKWLTWDQVDLVKGVILLHSTKNKEPRRVTVYGLALELLRAHAKVRRIGTNYVFPGEKTCRTKQPFELRVYFDEALKACGIENFRFHDLRHSTASYLAMNGASLLEIAEVLGHKTLQMVKRYSHLAESHTAGVVKRMNEKIFGL